MEDNPGSFERLISESDAAALLKITAGRLRVLRTTGRGPVFHQFGVLVGYRQSEVMAWAAATAEAGAADLSVRAKPWQLRKSRAPR
jgi:hypothetical protein